MGLTNPGQALERSSLLLISQKLLTMSGIPPFSTNSFRLASLLALLIGLNLSFQISTLVGLNKITKVIPSKMFHQVQFLTLYFSLISSMIFLLLCLFPSAALFMTICHLVLLPLGPTIVEATQGALIQLECWSEYWCLLEQMWGLFLRSGSPLD